MAETAMPQGKAGCVGDIQMAKKSRNEVVAGAFVLLGLLTALGVILWLGSSHLFHKPKGRAFFYREISAGPASLREGNPAKLGDIEFGQIVSIMPRLGEGRTLYIVELFREDIQLYADGKADVPFILVGDSFLNVTRTGDPNFGPTSETKPIPIVGGLADITNNVNKVTQSLSDQLDANRPDSLVRGLNDTIDNVKSISISLRFAMDANKNDSLLARVMAAVANVVTITADIRLATDPNRHDSVLATIGRMTLDAEPKVGKTLTDLSETSGKIRQYTDKDIAQLLAKLHDVGDELQKTMKNLDDLSGTAKSLVDRNAPSVDEIIENFVLVSANLKATATEVRRNPWRLLYKPEDKELNSANILDAARAFSAGAQQLDETVTRMNAIDPKTASPEDIKKLRDRLQQVFEKFSKAEQSLFKELGKP
jgi:methyl-accepting chemotaxis protein